MLMCNGRNIVHEQHLLAKASLLSAVFIVKGRRPPLIGARGETAVEDARRGRLLYKPPVVVYYY